MKNKEQTFKILYEDIIEPLKRLGNGGSFLSGSTLGLFAAMTLFFYFGNVAWIVERHTIAQVIDAISRLEEVPHD